MRLQRDDLGEAAARAQLERLTGVVGPCIEVGAGHQPEVYLPPNPRAGQAYFRCMICGKLWAESVQSIAAQELNLYMERMLASNPQRSRWQELKDSIRDFLTNGNEQ